MFSGELRFVPVFLFTFLRPVGYEYGFESRALATLVGNTSGAQVSTTRPVGLRGDGWAGLSAGSTSRRCGLLPRSEFWCFNDWREI
jgi:hypothetical protein